VNGAQNALLQNFMNANQGAIVYNDVPTAGNRNPSASANCTLPNLHEYCDRRSYAPQFGAQAAVYACPRSNLGLYIPACANTIGFTPLSTGGNTFRRGGFYNNREQQWVYMLNVNIHDLLAWNRAQGGAFFPPDITTDGGDVIFLSVKGSGAHGTSVGVGSPRYGVRIFGSPNLDFAPGAADPTGLTVVSDNAVYVEGDYNRGTSNCTFGNGACPWMPAAFFGDTINVLSNNWSGSAVCRNDCQSFQPLASRPATSTWIYAAFLGGVDDTTNGNYNGGLENYPRFHEDWSPANVTLTYRGSFVSLGIPQHNNGAWCGTGAACNIYNPPIRNWDYDTNFTNAVNLPPITPRFVTVQQILFTENFR
jgi:hypothetical protein